MRKEEHRHCDALVKWCHMNRLLIIHLANEGKRAPWIAKEIGIVKGAADYFLPYPRNGLGGAWIEMKPPKGKPRRSQEVFLELMRRNGYAAQYFDDWKKAADYIEQYLHGSNAGSK
jgi:hypothetical protein